MCPVFLAFMRVCLMTPTLYDDSLRVIPIVSLAVKLDYIVSIYRLHRHLVISRMHGALYLGQCLAGRVPPASLGQVPAVGWQASPVPFPVVMVQTGEEGRDRLATGAPPETG